MNLNKYKELPEHLFAAYKWISAAGEWDEAVKTPKKYAKAAYDNAVENEQLDVTEDDLLEVINWYKNNDNQH